MTTESETLRVALIYDATKAYDVCVAMGVASYFEQGANWDVIVVGKEHLYGPGLGNFPASELDGVIANFDITNLFQSICRSRVPAIGFGSGYGDYDSASGIPYFFTNNSAIARMAVDLLLNRGIRNFAYFGYCPTDINGWSEERETEFSQYVHDKGLECRSLREPNRDRAKPADTGKSLGQWLLSLPKPLGLMAANDSLAREVIHACHVCGILVPLEVSVIGVDNDESLYRFCHPLLTSIEQGAHRLGYEAAQLLDSMMGGKSPGTSRYVIDPVGVFERGSTIAGPIIDSLFEQAMRYIRAHACEGIKVPDVVAATKTSRSRLEAHFKAECGQTLHDAIHNEQLAKVKTLITESTLSLKEIAAATGLKSVQHMSSLFREAFGMPPAAFRRKLKDEFRELGSDALHFSRIG